MKAFFAAAIFLLVYLAGCINEPTCGNLICEDNETAENCASDCSIDVRSCNDLNGHLCNISQTCPKDELPTSDNVICCPVECEIPVDDPDVEYICSTDIDCDDGNPYTNDFCILFPRECSHVYKTCSEIGANSCDIDSICEGEEINITDQITCCSGICSKLPACEILNCADNEKCLGGRCILKTCEEQGGIGCGLPKECRTELIPSSNATICCDPNECVKPPNTATCSSDYGCKLGCESGDKDCKCSEQGGISVHHTECPTNEKIEAYDVAFPNECCLDPFVYSSCVDEDGGYNISVKGSCISTGVTISGKIIDLGYEWPDYCARNKLSELICAQVNDTVPDINVPVYDCRVMVVECSCFDGACIE